MSMFAITTSDPWMDTTSLPRWTRPPLKKRPDMPRSERRRRWAETATVRPGVRDNGAMTGTDVFMFADDGLELFATEEDAAAYMEWVDVESGDVYEALFTVEGKRLWPRQLNEYNVRLEPAEQVDIETLRSLLRREKAQRGTFTSDPDDPVAVANEMRAKERDWRWSRRWPRWPRWLDVRLHGAKPPAG